jgi:hypothetical protein
MVENKNIGKDLLLVFYRVGPDGDDFNYLVNLDKIVTPVFISDPREILQLEHGEVVITEKENFSELPEFILIKIEKIAEGRIGHHVYVAFKVNNPLRKPSPQNVAFNDAVKNVYKYSK